MKSTWFRHIFLLCTDKFTRVATATTGLLLLAVHELPLFFAYVVIFKPFPFLLKNQKYFSHVFTQEAQRDGTVPVHNNAQTCPIKGLYKLSEICGNICQTKKNPYIKQTSFFVSVMSHHLKFLVELWWHLDLWFSKVRSVPMHVIAGLKKSISEFIT